MTMETSPLYLAGAHVGGEGRTIDVENPATGQIVGRVDSASVAQLDEAVNSAVEAQREWKTVPTAARAETLRRLASLLEDNRERLARTVCLEIGKPISEARGEVGGAIGFAELFAGIATTQGGDILPSSAPNQELWIKREPRGVVGGIIPWNFPLALTLRKLAPALASGNGIVLKPAELSPLSALAVADLAEEAGVPNGLVSVLPGPGSVIGDALVRHPDIAFVTMTGSVNAGKSIMAAAAERVIPVSLELGGKAPFIVFDDADVEAAAVAAVQTRMMNNGQACVCNERTYVQSGVFDRFVARYVELSQAMIVGDPFDDETEVGPKVSLQELENVERLVGDAVDRGAEVLTGGKRLTGGIYDSGYWYAPTVLTGVSSSADIMTQETFGPVTPIVPFDSETDAVRMANSTDYGLSSYVYTRDFGTAMRMIDGIESGEVFINRGGPEENTGFHAGWGLSGIGGDDGIHGYDLYCRRKTAYVAWEGSAA
ncbi:aldehyde dehydrogenase family protein [Paramicrobacterium chengjingii]|uniref:Aldehyde dehydrogenase family protein n=1 Tax=Paramicrobacterium chengjingii TaxID=2769067 RepID=A0ABX6YHP2_9MICO|nr:aldehyde dehydrogenase family protein [Microbacterium chengjingii]QPZ38308.1 aldehyde dehydrogenase family protein [Microbacterium chengjingii]